MLEGVLDLLLITIVFRKILRYILECHPSLVCNHVIGMSLVCTRMSSVCHSYVLACPPYVTFMYLYVIRMSLVCTHVSSYVIRMWFEFLDVYMDHLRYYLHENIMYRAELNLVEQKYC